MKLTLSTIAAIAAITLSAHAADVKITDVHICCKGCVTGVEEAIAKVDGVKAEADKDAHTITLTAADTATLQKGADALIKAGYYGKSEDSNVKMHAHTGAKGEKVTSLKIEGVHLCCGKCVTAVDKALKTVDGVKEHTAVKNAKSFEVTGEFNDKEVFAALQKAGLTGKVAN